MNGRTSRLQIKGIQAPINNAEQMKNPIKRATGVRTPKIAPSMVLLIIRNKYATYSNKGTKSTKEIIQKLAPRKTYYKKVQRPKICLPWCQLKLTGHK